MPTEDFDDYDVDAVDANGCANVARVWSANVQKTFVLVVIGFAWNDQLRSVVFRFEDVPCRLPSEKSACS
jgi:hypothetical protein